RRHPDPRRPHADRPDARPSANRRLSADRHRHLRRPRPLRSNASGFDACLCACHPAKGARVVCRERSLMTTLDLNADLGEGLPNDAALLEIVSSASIACGGHAGTRDTIRAALRAAKAQGVVAGAHPGFADPEHFGRRRLDISAEELTRQMRTQLELIGGLAREEGVELRYAKLHGALANMAAEDEHIASIAFAAVRNHDAHLAVLAIDNSAQVAAAEALGLKVILEAYADRAYQPDGLL